jgi:transcription elongation factor GreA
MLYETPIKVHKFLFTFLVSSKKYKEINSFIQNVILGYRNFPEVFLWTAKNIFSKVWTYEWLDYPYDTLILNFFRLFKELQKIEPKGVRLKNLAMEILKSNNYAILREIVKEKDIDVVRKIYEMILDADFLDEAQKEELLNVIKSERKDILSHLAEEEKEEVKEEEDFVYITEQKYNELLEEFNKVVNVELPNVAKQISEAVEYGDLRENAEYKAALDKQNILRSMAKKLENDIKKARIIKGENIDTTKISIGTKVILLNMTEGEEEEYTILGPYEADYENHIISYLSPFGKAMMNKKVGDTFSINIGDEKREYKVIRIEKSDKI